MMDITLTKTVEEVIANVSNEISASDSSKKTEFEGEPPQHFEVVGVVSGVSGNLNYYEKDGLRVYGADEDHGHEPAMSPSRFMSLVAMSFIWTGSQIPLYLFGACPPLIYRDLGGYDRYIWFILGNLLASAAICPFVGTLSDLIGRRWTGLSGASLILIGIIVASTAHNMNVFIGGMTIAGGGAGISELTALAVVSEIAPTAKRGTYNAVLIFTILPFAPSVLWGQLIASKSEHVWRYLGLLCGIWAFIGLMLTFFFYHPPPRINSLGLTRRETLAQVDWLGGMLSIGGIMLFIMSLVWVGNQYEWRSPHVLSTLILGVIMLVAFCFWEVYGAKYPMFPRRLRREPRILGLTLVITFISGINFISILLFWPTQSFNVYGQDPIGVGLRGLPIGLGIIFGACIVLILLSKLRGYNRMLLLGSSIMMVAGTGAMAALTVDSFRLIYGLLTIAGLGIGGIVVPASIISTIVSPDDLIATITALTLSIRVMGGAIGYATYYNVFTSKLVPLLTENIVLACFSVDMFNVSQIIQIADLVAISLVDKILPILDNNKTAQAIVVHAGQEAFAGAYKYVYYVSIPFGVVSIIAACFLGDVSKYMDEHVAVVYH